MKTFLTACLLLLATNLSAQTVVGDRFRLNTGPCVLRSGSGTPESAVTGSTCDMYVDTANGTWYTKWSGTNTNTGWRVGHNANAIMSGSVGTSNFVSQLTGWRITSAGEADFRYLFADELHVKNFIADLEQALAGGQIICKSVTSLGANFTNPAAAGTATLTVRDLPSAPNVAVFQANDWVGVRTFSRTAGSLTVADSFGVVTSYADQANGLQTWTYTRGTGANGGGMATSTVVETDAIVIDYGVSTNGCHEVNAIDGLNSVNSPYSQTWNWTTSPIAANRSIGTRLGRLNGISGNATEYGLIAGVVSTGAAAHYIRASNVVFQMFGVDLQQYDSTTGTNTFRLEPTGPSMALGSPMPTAFGTGTGLWTGKDAGAYKFRVGNPAGNRLVWDGTSLSIFGDGGGVTNINGANIQTGTITADKITTGSLSAISANIGTITAGSITGVTIAGSTITAGGGAVVLNSAGITLTNGAGSVNQVKWNDGSNMFSSGGLVQVHSTGGQFQMRLVNGFITFQQGTIFYSGNAGAPGNGWNSGFFSGTMNVGGFVNTNTGYTAAGNTGVTTSFGVNDSGCPGSGRRSIFIHGGIVFAVPCQ